MKPHAMFSLSLVTLATLGGCEQMPVDAAEPSAPTTGAADSIVDGEPIVSPTSLDDDGGLETEAERFRWLSPGEFGTRVRFVVRKLEPTTVSSYTPEELLARVERVKQVLQRDERGEFLIAGQRYPMAWLAPDEIPYSARRPLRGGEHAPPARVTLSASSLYNRRYSASIQPSSRYER